MKIRHVEMMNRWKCQACQRSGGKLDLCSVLSLANRHLPPPCFPSCGCGSFDLFAHWHSQSLGDLGFSFPLSPWWVPWQSHRKWLWSSIKPFSRGAPARPVTSYEQGNKQWQHLPQYVVSVGGSIPQMCDIQSHISSPGHENWLLVL